MFTINGYPARPVRMYEEYRNLSRERARAVLAWSLTPFTNPGSDRPPNKKKRM